MRASPWLMSLAIATGLGACQPAQPDATVAAPAAQQTPPAPVAADADERRYHFQCGDLAVQATYHGQDAATVVVGERTLAMVPAEAASGAKYADAQGNTFWTKGTTDGTLALKGEPERRCTGTGEAGPTPMPAADAAVTDVGFRATGNEPGWLAEVAAGATPQLRVETDYGQRTFAIDNPTQGKDGWSGKAADGTEVKLSFQRTVCQDDMSGKAFGTTAMLTVGARQYHGCGDFAGAPALAARP
ncbi:MliC family protein [Stenotrophomonas sp.]|uniref:MliC family protein n=1 Tax=Stenotrophomonas sp. TaxID=69392 RepID=UPI002FC97A8B